MKITRVLLKTRKSKQQTQQTQMRKRLCRKNTRSKSFFEDGNLLSVEYINPWILIGPFSFSCMDIKKNDTKRDFGFVLFFYDFFALIIEKIISHTLYFKYFLLSGAQRRTIYCTVIHDFVLSPVISFLPSFLPPTSSYQFPFQGSLPLLIFLYH